MKNIPEAHVCISPMITGGQGAAHVHGDHPLRPQRPSQRPKLWRSRDHGHLRQARSRSWRRRQPAATKAPNMGSMDSALAPSAPQQCRMHAARERRCSLPLVRAFGYRSNCSTYPSKEHSCPPPMPPEDAAFVRWSTAIC